MSEPIKLKNVGDKVTIDVVKAGLLPFGKRPEIEFVGSDGKKVWVPKASADRQLARFNLTPEGTVGRRITIGRSASSDPDKPFWDLFLADGTPTVATVAKERASETKGGAANAATSDGAASASQKTDLKTSGTTPAASQNGSEKDSALYVRMTRFVLKDVRPLYEEAGLPFDANVAAAITATLYIQAKR